MHVGGCSVRLEHLINFREYSLFYDILILYRTTSCAIKLIFSRDKANRVFFFFKKLYLLS